VVSRPENTREGRAEIEALGARVGRLFVTPRRRYAAVAFGGQVSYAIVAFAGSVLAARLLGVEGKGEYTAWTLMSATGALLLAGSAPTGFGRAYLLGETGGFRRAAALHAAVVALGAVVGGVVCVLVGLDPVATIACIVIGVPASLLAFDLVLAMQAAKQAWRYHAPRVTQGIVVTGGFVVLTIFQPSDPLELAFVVWAGALLISAAVALRLAPSGGGASVTLARSRELGRGSYFARLIDWLFLRLDQLIVLVFTGPAGLGIYSVAVNWSEIGQYLGHSLGEAMFEDERTLEARASRRVLGQVLRAMLLAAAFTGLSGLLLISPVFGADFAEARWLLLLLVPGVVARGLGYSASQMLFASGRGASLSRAMIWTLVIGGGAIAAGTAVLGVYGAAIGSSVLYGLQALLATRLQLGFGDRR
jgi:O-antigen/teichoic acid export membrane protein